MPNPFIVFLILIILFIICIATSLLISVILPKNNTNNEIINTLPRKRQRKQPTVALNGKLFNNSKFYVKKDDDLN